MQFSVKPAVLAAFMSLPTIVSATNLEVNFNIPDFESQKYAKPYVSIWAEADRKATPLLLWHMVDQDDKWLKDIRRWWRKIGRYDTYIDSYTGATKGPGQYKETLDIGDLESFTLYVEVVREFGGRSLVKTNIDVNDNKTSYNIPADVEIGDINIKVKH